VSDDLKRAMDKLAFVKFKGADYMTHLGHPDCVAILDEIERLKTSLSNAAQQLFGGAELGGGLKARSGSMMQSLNIEAGSTSSELELARAEVNRLRSERDEFWGQTHFKEGVIQRLKRNMSEIARELKPQTPDVELTPEDAVRLAKYLRSISDSAARTLKLFDERGVWTGFDDDVYDRVVQVLIDRDAYKERADRLKDENKKLRAGCEDAIAAIDLAYEPVRQSQFANLHVTLSNAALSCREALGEPE
jgi:hypothetical protein